MMRPRMKRLPRMVRPSPYRNGHRWPARAMDDEGGISRGRAAARRTELRGRDGQVEKEGK